MPRFDSFARFALLISLSSCSLVLDSEKKQCKRSADCNDFSSGEALICVGGACVQSPTEECTRSSACAMEDGELCNIETRLCDPSARCEQDEDCAKTFEGAENYICEEKSCRPPECLVPADCEMLGADFECTENRRCRDTKWGCIDEPDPRTGVDGEGTYRVRVLYVNLAGDQLPIPNFEARLCITVDPNCEVSAGREQTYDEDGWLTIKGLRQQKYILQLTGDSPDDGTPLLRGRSYLHRPVIGDVEEPQPLLMFTAATRSLFESALGVATNWEETGLLIARVYDCRDQSAPGIIFSTAPEDVAACPNMKEGCQTQPFYFDESNVPRIDASGGTDNYGVGGILNLKKDVKSTISFVREETDERYARIEIVPNADEVTYSAIYPGKQ